MTATLTAPTARFSHRPPRAATPEITNADRRRLAALLACREGRAWGGLKGLGELETILEVYPCLEGALAPESLVTMNSIVEIADCDTGQRRLVRLVYPVDVDLAPEAVSVLDPLGLALFGRRVGDVIQSPAANDARWRIAAMIYQPERAGAHRL